MKYCNNCKHKMGFVSCKAHERYNKYLGTCLGSTDRKENQSGDCDGYVRAWWKWWVRNDK